MQGYVLPDAQKKAIAAKLAAYTGTSADYWEKADLRVSHQQFLQELKRDQRMIAAHRFTIRRPVGESARRKDGLRSVFPAVGRLTPPRSSITCTRT